MSETKAQVERIVEAAISWRYEQGNSPVLNITEWRLYEALSDYGDTFKGVSDD